ncbi:MAG: flagellar biosynthetic protein FliR [Treponemataceae bacterium]
MLGEIVANAPWYFLVAARALALIETAPLLSSDATPQVAKIALAGFVAFLAYPSAPIALWNVQPYSVDFALLVVGEVLIGIIIGFYLTIIFSAFSTAGQLFSLQMGFGASEVYDPLAQIENPLMGQYLNLIALFTFLSASGFRKLFLGGFMRSLQSISAVSLVTSREGFLNLLLSGLSRLFIDAIVISMPILGTLFLVSVGMGLLSKAAPQMNLLTEGFPISITVAFSLILITMPFLVESFVRVIDGGFFAIEGFLAHAGGGIK